MPFEPRPLATEQPASPSMLRYRSMVAMLTVIVVGVWLGMFLLPGIGTVLGLGLLCLLGALAVLGSAMGLGWLGFRLFDAFDHLAAWSTQPPEWFHDESTEEGGRER